MAAGEGIETMLSLRQVLPDMPMAAALSAAHLAAILFPDTLRRLYIVRDNDPAGDGARWQPDRPGERGRDRGDRAFAGAGDFNEDLRRSASTRSGQRPGADRSQDVAASWLWRHSRHGAGGRAGRLSCPHRMRPLGEDRASAFERAIGPQTARSGNGGGRLFSGARRRRLSIAKQNSRPSPSSAALRPSLRSGCRSVRPWAFVAMKAATVAVQPTEHPMTSTTTTNPTTHIPDRPCPQELQLYGYRPFEDEPDPRPLPEGNHRRRRRRHLRRPDRHHGRHPPRTRPRRSPLVDRQHSSTAPSNGSNATRRQRAGAEAPSARTGRQRGEIRRARTPDRRGQT
jgi:hypothetical protein